MSDSPLSTPPITSSFRDMVEDVTLNPTYLLGPIGRRYRYTMALMDDVLADAATFAVLARFPFQCPPDAFPWLSQDRLILQGPNETEASYSQRLVEWLDLWGYAGLPTGILLAMLAQVIPNTPQVRLVDNTGNWHTYTAGFNPLPNTMQPPLPSTLTPAAGNWMWDGDRAGFKVGNGDPFGFSYQWFRAWLIIYSTSSTPWAAPTATWAPATGTITVSVISDATYGTVYSGSGGSGTNSTQFSWDGGVSGTYTTMVAYGNRYYGSLYSSFGGPPVTFSTPTWDWTGSAATAQVLVSEAERWRAAHVHVVHVIVSYDATMFDPTQTLPSSKLPDGQWGHWNKVSSDATYGSFYDASRPASSTCSILDGTPITGVLG